MTCGLCEGDIGSDGSAGSPSPGPGAGCIGDAAVFDSGYGDCASYGEGGENHEYCSEDQDVYTGNIAADVCPGCGVCMAAFLQRNRSRNIRNKKIRNKKINMSAGRVA